MVFVTNYSDSVPVRILILKNTLQATTNFSIKNYQACEELIVIYVLMVFHVMKLGKLFGALQMT